MVKNLRILTGVVAVMVVIDALITPLVLVWANLDPNGLIAIAGPNGSGIDAASLGFKLLTMIVFGRWIYVAGKNLQDAELDLEFTPGSRIWWFAVPVACLFKPFQGMREMWNASHGNAHYDENNGLVTTWWCLWLVGNLGSYIANLVSAGSPGLAPLWLMAGVDIALAAVAILMIRAIAQAQGRTLAGGHLEEVFA